MSTAEAVATQEVKAVKPARILEDKWVDHRVPMSLVKNLLAFSKKPGVLQAKETINPLNGQKIPRIDAVSERAAILDLADVRLRRHRRH